MSFSRFFDDSGPVRPAGAGPAGDHEHRPGRSTRLGTGTLACPGCDAPVAPGPVPLMPTSRLICPFCLKAVFVRDFLSHGWPPRPALVLVPILPSAAPERL